MVEDDANAQVFSNCNKQSFLPKCNVRFVDEGFYTAQKHIISTDLLQFIVQHEWTEKSKPHKAPFVLMASNYVKQN